MEFLKTIFGDKALTYAELEAALKDSKEIKLGNLATGQYVDKAKLEGKITELDTANQTIKDLQDTVKKFDGVDLEKLKKDVSDWEQKYNTDTAKLKLNYALETALMAGKAKNTKAVINGVEWQSRKAATQRKTGQVAADNVRIIIPFRARTKSVYIKPKAWEQLGALS